MPMASLAHDMKKPWRDGGIYVQMGLTRATSSHLPFQEQHSHGAAGTEVEQQVSPERQIADAENSCDRRRGRSERSKSCDTQEA